MLNNLFEVIKIFFTHIFNLKIVDIPLHIAYLAISGLCGYCSAMILIGFPVSVWEHFTKKKVREDIESKLIKIIAICFAVVMFTRVIYEKAV